VRGCSPVILRIQLHCCRCCAASPRVQNERRQRGLIEIERSGEIVRARTASGEGLEAEPPFDELQDRGEFEHAVIDMAGSYPGRDDQERNPRAKAKVVDLRWGDMVVEPAEKKWSASANVRA
jgi:hypothetical protein